MDKIGEPVRLFTTDERVTFEDVTGAEITVPSGTLWLESEINNEQVEKELDDLVIVAYSVTISEKNDADTVMEIYNKLSTKNATKEEINLDELKRIDENITSKRTLIKDIEDPVMLTTSVVKFPCVSKARFCKKSLMNNYKEENDEAIKMSSKEDTNANKTFLNKIQEAITDYRNTSSEKEEVKVDDEDINAIIDEKLAGIKEEFGKQIEDIQEGIITAIQEISTPTGESNDDKDDKGGEGGEGGEDGGSSEKTEPTNKTHDETKVTVGRGDKKRHKVEAPLKTA